MDDLRKWSSQLVPKLAEREFERAVFEEWTPKVESVSRFGYKVTR